MPTSMIVQTGNCTRPGIIRRDEDKESRRSLRTGGSWCFDSREWQYTDRETATPYEPSAYL